MNIFDVIIVGAGASGLFAAANFKEVKTLIIDANSQLATKVRISGGGKCNFTNRDVSFLNYTTENVHFTKSPLSRFTPDDFIELITSKNLKFEERDNGKLFAFDSKHIIDILVSRFKSDNVTIKLNTEAYELNFNGDNYSLSTSNGEFVAKKVIIATGGLSCIKGKASKFGYDTAIKFGQNIVMTTPALTPLCYCKKDDFSELSGISIKAKMKVGKKEFIDQLLFTHNSFSGPLALNISLYFKPNDAITINFAPDINFENFFKEAMGSKKSFSTLLSYHIPKSLVHKLFKDKDYYLTKLKKTEKDEIIDKLTNYQYIPSSVLGFEKAEVTKGGISTKEISSSDMSVKNYPNLHFVGEVLDVTGELGGYNLHWAWASGNAVK